MNDPVLIIDTAIKELEYLKKILKKKKISQVNSLEEKDLVKATSYSWIKSHQIKLNSVGLKLEEISINNLYCDLLDFSEKRTKRLLYIGLINDIKKSLILFRSKIVTEMSSGIVIKSNLNDLPNFNPLISDPKMIKIIERRWIEIEKCLQNEAPLAATVMMGGLLESILMARVNKIDNKRVLFKQKSTPKDGKTNKPKQLSEWMLKDFIDVLNEIKIITRPSADFSRLIRDYRNYIHPEKELRKGDSIEVSDAELFWVTTVSLIKQLLNS